MNKPFFSKRAEQKMSNSKRQRSTFDAKPGLAILNSWLSDHPPCTTSHIAMAFRGPLYRIRTNLSESSLNNLWFYEKMGHCRYKLCIEAAKRQDLSFIYNVIGSYMINEELAEKICAFAIKYDNLEMYDFTEQHFGHGAVSLTKFKKYLPKTIIESRNRRKYLTPFRTLAVYNFLRENHPDRVLGVGDILPDAEFELLDKLRTEAPVIIGQLLPQGTVPSTQYWGPLRYFFEYGHTHVDFVQFSDFMKIRKGFDFERICNYHSVDFSGYQNLGSDNCHQYWLRKGPVFLDGNDLFKACQLGNPRELKEVERVPNDLQCWSHEFFNDEGRAYSAEQAKFILEHDFFVSQNERRLFFTIAFEYGDKSLLQYLTESYWADLEAVFDSSRLCVGMLRTDTECVEKLDYIYSKFQPAQKRIYCDTISSIVHEREICFRWFLTKLHKRYHWRIAKEINGACENIRIEFAMKVDPKYSPFNRGAALRSYSLNSKERIRFALDNFIKIKNPERVLWPDDYDFFVANIQRIGYDGRLVFHIRHQWSQKNYQLFQDWVKRNETRQIVLGILIN